MAVEFNHTIIHARNKVESAKFLSDILGLPAPAEFGPFVFVKTSNGVSLDFFETDEKFDLQHYAFLVSEEEFDQIFSRIRARGLTYWDDPSKSNPGQTYTFNGGRGVYFDDPSGHFMEIHTRPYVG